MSFGVMCLTCRKFVREEVGTESEWVCKCAEPIPSVDGKTAATPDEVKRALQFSKQMREGR